LNSPSYKFQHYPKEPEANYDPDKCEESHNGTRSYNVPLWIWDFVPRGLAEPAEGDGSDTQRNKQYSEEDAGGLSCKEHHDSANEGADAFNAQTGLVKG
jgi:hypothetical protein